MANLRRPIFTADCETDPFKHGRIPTPFLWGIYTGESYHELATPEQVADFLGPKRAVVYAHNGGKFDWHFLLPYINREEPITIINGRLAKFKIGVCEFRDSYNIMPVPLSMYKKDEIDYAIMEPGERDKPKNMKTIRKYLKGDCTYLHELVSAFIREFGFELTQASAAFKYWYTSENIIPPRSDHDYFMELKPYYFGGRVQCFESGIIKQPFELADINSAYPRAMMEYHPISTRFTVHDKLPNVCHIGPSFLDVECVSRGAFPYRTSEGLFFPDDGIRRVYHVTGWEYLAALETRTISRVRVVKCYTFSALTHFKKYITYFYNRRLRAKAEGDAATTLLMKLGMNSLYGRFAIDTSDHQEYQLFDKFELWKMQDAGYDCAGLLGPWALGATNRYAKRDNNGHISEQDEEKRDPQYINIATSASITGWVRAYLWRQIHRCKQPLYCDTDAIAATNLSFLKYGKELGEFTHEGRFCEAAIAGKKLYAFKYAKQSTEGKAYKTATKGVRLTPQEIYKIAKGGTVDYRPDTPTFSPIAEPSFIPRKVKMTAKDITRLPEDCYE